ncbi:peptide transporter [Oxalobacteraceae bacterium CAVE-383]|nr:peptide transporter [Oxalobacteraceae bacterium CAVE-383]
MTARREEIDATAAEAAGTAFSLEKFEFLCYSRQHETAARELVRLLKLIDTNYGRLDTHVMLPRSAAMELMPESLREQHLLNRVAGAISALFSDPDFQISIDGFGRLIVFQRWLAALFAASAFVNCDHILKSLNALGPDAAEFQVTERDLPKFCILYSPESELPLNVELLWRQNRPMAAGLFLALLSPRFLGTPIAHGKREALLGWLPAHLDEIESLDGLPLGILHDVYMHCSYADLPGRHEIKRPINRLIRKQLAAVGLHDVAAKGAYVSPAPKSADAAKPVMLVLLEWFGRTHSIYRTHAKTLTAARARFHVVAMASAAHIDDAGCAVFDEVIELGAPDDMRAGLQQLHAFAAARKPAVFYMPSVGMFPITMYAANLRLAPLQVAALGHPATTHSDCIDYISVEDDFVGDPACFSEKLLRLPRDGQPYWPPVLKANDGRNAAARAQRMAGAERMGKEEGADRPPVNIAVAATIMKLNPRFLLACRQIQVQAQSRIRFHFLVGQAQGLTTPQVLRLIRSYLPGAEVYPHRPYADYMATLDACDMFISPFPFGNTNGIIDAVMLGVPGVCKTGPEVFEHIDEGLFRRLRLPDWSIAATVEAYIQAAVRMADNGAERAALYRQLEQPAALDVLFDGRPEALGEALYHFFL